MPPVETRRVHLVAVAAGGKREVSFTGGGPDDSGYVHVLDEEAFREILSELDTAPDLLHYLATKEAFPGRIVCEGEENLLAAYLHAGRKMPADARILVAEDGLWLQVRSKPEFLARKEADRVSYWWDRMIETFIADYELAPEAGPSQSDHEKMVRTLAAEDRFARRILSEFFLDWLHRKQAGARNAVFAVWCRVRFRHFPSGLVTRVSTG